MVKQKRSSIQSARIKIRPIPDSVKEARAGLIPSEETDALLPSTGPLEYLQRRGLADHCEMCGVKEFKRKPGSSSNGERSFLEPAFDPSGEPKTLCRDCRIGSAELLADRRLSFDEQELATVLAALRYWQRAIGVDSLPVGPLPKSEYMHHFNFSGDEEDQCMPLSAEEIDALCERINL
jgi:hypothetical protein